MAHTGAAAPDPLTLRIALAPGAAAGSASLYEDEGDGFGYEEGAYARRVIDCDGRQVRIGAREGAWIPPRERVVVELHGKDGVHSITVDETDSERVVELE